MEIIESHGALVVPGRGAGISQADALRNRFLRSKREGRTRDAYERDLEHWYHYCAETGIDPMQACALHVEDWVRVVEETPTRTGKPPKPATVHRMVSAVRGLYKHAKDHGILAENPVRSAHALNLATVPTRSTTKSLTQAEAVRFLDVARTRSIRDVAMMAVLLYQGVRVGGLCQLDVEDLSTELGYRTITVRLKGGDVQVQVIADDVAPLVDEWLAARGNHAAGAEVVQRSPTARRGGTPLFTDRCGERVKYWNVEAVVRACAKGAKVEKKISPHSLRHTIITHLLDLGAPLRDVQEFAGHRNPATTIRYDRGVRQLQNSPVHRLRGYFG